MRLFYFLLLIPSLAIAGLPNCDESDLIAGTVGCSSLTIDQDMLLGGNGAAAPLDIVVNGNVSISANIILDGANGIPLATGNEPARKGGPGGFEGGAISSNSATPGQFILQGGLQGQFDGACSAGGGGGASQMTNGNPGGICSAGTLDGPAGTAPADFPGVLSGGNGGGAGGEQSLGGGVFDLGGGGGGGGGIRIRALAGTITIANGIVISAKGGRGGNSLNIGGAGGGGGGGTIHLIGDIAVVNKGILDVTAGSGGLVGTTSPHGGVGGTGGNGIIRIEDGVNLPQDFSGRQDFSTGTPTSTTSNLKSSISCASLAKKNDQNNLAMQMIVGFMMAMILRILFRHQKRIS